MDGPITSLFTVALREEADPIIAELDLKRDTGSTNQPLYFGEDAALVVCGIGKMKAAAGTARLFSLRTVSSHATAINFGIAGGIDPARSPISELFLINKIVDSGSEREFFPDIFVESQLSETMVTTFDRPVTRQQKILPVAGLVDMEAAGFYEAAALFVGPHRMTCLKIVSDHLEGKRLPREYIHSLAQENAPRAISLVREIVSVNGRAQSTFSDDEREWIDLVKDALRLTVTQTHMLREWLIAHRLRHLGRLPELSGEVLTRVKTKAERNRRFEEIRKTLAS